MKAIERVIKIIESQGLNNSAFEKKIEVSNGYIAKQLSRNADLGEGVLLKILENSPNINPEWLLTGKGEMFKNSEPSNVNIIPIKQSRSKKLEVQEVPLYDTTATASILSIFSDQNKNIPLEYIRIPNLPKCDGAIPITGDSMYPLLKSGDIILYKEGHDKDFIIWGEMYLVYLESDGEEYFAVKYLQKGSKEDRIKLVSYNDHHAPKEFPISALKKWALVKASIRINSAI